MLDKLKKSREELTVVAPYTNIYEEKNNIVIAIEMPGADKDTLDVNLDGNELIIRGEKKKDEIGKGYSSVYKERTPVTYERRFEINTHIDREKINARFENGILKISLAKSEAAQPKKISIST